ncbi:hypothetical protein BFR57_03375 [Idiomarina sp. MD25a]|uniref:glycosyltransferase n=1 Tax=Idiomarina sp. MD25a TaxID=1889913 RepID=UPI0008F88542|nr:glycosyltransferase [Idiomarina sp. MD25a]OIM99619.1 hypothetical protein BFR57_03375 [Idiomarina sp. MD25a]
MKLHLIGARPGPIGGTTVLFEQLVIGLESNPHIQLYVTDTSKIKKVSVLDKFRYLFRSITYCMNSEITVLNVSANGALYFGPLFLFICKLFRKKFALRMFGGVFNQTYLSYGFVKRFLVRLTISNSGITFFETDLVSSFFESMYPDRKIVRLPNSRPISSYTCQHTNKNKFAFVGAIKRSKGVGEIIEVAKRYRETEFFFAGPVVENDLIEEINERPNCKYLGIIGPDSIHEFLVEMSCLILPTRHFGEGHPGVILEAYSVGLPVIATKWRSVPEIIVDGTTGFLVEVDDLEQLAETIRKFELMDITERRRMGHAARDYFLSSYESCRVRDLFLRKISEIFD